MAVNYTSRVFAVHRNIARDLALAEWPHHPYTNIQPELTVGVGDRDFAMPTEGAESIGVIQRVETDAQIVWARIGRNQQRDESFTVEVVCRTYVPGMTDSTHVLDRLEQLCDVVQSLVFDNASGTFTAPGGEGEQWGVDRGGTARVTFRVLPSDEGWLGMASVLFQINTRI